MHFYGEPGVCFSHTCYHANSLQHSFHDPTSILVQGSMKRIPAVSDSPHLLLLLRVEYLITLHMSCQFLLFKQLLVLQAIPIDSFSNVTFEVMPENPLVSVHAMSAAQYHFCVCTKQTDGIPV